MKNLDLLQQKKEEVVNKINEALKEGNEELFQEAFTEYTDILQEAVMTEARGFIQAADNNVLVGRGVRALTSKETEYYQKVIDAMQSADPAGGLAGVDETIPETVIDAVFEDIQEEHPLLSIINFQNTEGMIKYLYSTMENRHLASWGALCSKIIEELSAEFKILHLEQTKLSAFIPVCKAMLDLGPKWLDRYVRTILAEAIANGLEDGIINGRGIADAGADATANPAINEPIGMIRDLTNGPVNGVGYAAKTPIPIADFLPETYLPLITNLVRSPNGLCRKIKEVLMVVNPVDYLTKVVPATIFKRPDGTYVLDIFPFPTRVVQSVYVDSGRAVIGLPKRYLMAMGIGKGGKIEYSDHYRFLEDERIYLTKFYGTGRPLDNTSFFYLDISNVKPIVPSIKVVTWPDAKLKKLETYGPAATKLAFDKVFDANVHYYSTDFESATKTGKIVAEATDENAVVTATLNGTAQALNTSFDYEEGKNVIIITVENGNVTEMYAVVVDYSTGS